MTKLLHVFTLAFAMLFAVQVTSFAQVPTEEDQDRPIMNGEGDIITVLEDHEELSLFAEALRQSGVDAELTAEGPFTVFAPNNEAFEKKLNGVDREEHQERPPYDEEEQEQEWQDRAQQHQQMFQDLDVEQLANVVRSHIVMGEVRAADLQPGTELQTIEGTMLTVREREDETMRDDDPYDPEQREHEPQQERQEQHMQYADVQIENSRILQTDIEADNGVIHILDEVLDVVEIDVPVTGE